MCRVWSSVVTCRLSPRPTRNPNCPSACRLPRGTAVTDESLTNTRSESAPMRTRRWFSTISLPGLAKIVNADDDETRLVRVSRAKLEVLEEQTSVLWRRERTTSHALAKNVHPDMEPAAYGLLMLLQREDSMRLTELAASIGVGKPSVSRQVALLEQLGLVQKETDPLDARAQAITLTEAGRVKLHSAQTARKAA